MVSSDHDVARYNKTHVMFNTNVRKNAIPSNALS
jgi:hypothetical protein